jgi:hypothetical protein
VPVKDVNHRTGKGSVQTCSGTTYFTCLPSNRRNARTSSSLRPSCFQDALHSGSEGKRLGELANGQRSPSEEERTRQSSGRSIGFRRTEMVATKPLKLAAISTACSLACR